MTSTVVATERARRRLSWWAAICLIAALTAGTWWLSSIGLSHGPDHMVGPYAVPLALEYGAGLGCFAAGLVAAVAGVIGRPAHTGISLRAMAPLSVAAIVATGSWRAVTAGVVGANIGGGLVALVGPIAVAASLFGAVVVERSARSRRMRSFAVVAGLAWATAPILFAGVWLLSR